MSALPEKRVSVGGQSTDPKAERQAGNGQTSQRSSSLGGTSAVSAANALAVPAFTVSRLPIRQTPEQRRRAQRVVEVTRGMDASKRFALACQFLIMYRSLDAAQWDKVLNSYGA